MNKYGYKGNMYLIHMRILIINTNFKKIIPLLEITLKKSKPSSLVTYFEGTKLSIISIESV